MVSVAVIVVALLLEAGILKYVNDENAYRVSKVLLDRVVTVLDKNDQSEEELIESLKDDYIVRAKAVSYIVDAKPQDRKSTRLNSSHDRQSRMPSSA